MFHLSVAFSLAFAPCSSEAQVMQMQMYKLDKRGLCQLIIRIIRLDCGKMLPYDTVISKYSYVNLYHFYFIFFILKKKFSVFNIYLHNLCDDLMKRGFLPHRVLH